jgi:hypothetical protein
VVRAIIVANGRAVRMGRDKELLDVAYRGEKIPLLLRTVEQMQARGVREKEIYVFSRKPCVETMFAASDVNVVNPGETAFMLETWEKTLPYWSKENVMSLGDVLWSEWGMDMMFMQRRYRRIGSSSKHGGEGFGWKMFGGDAEMIRPHLDFALDYIRKNGPRPGDGGWQMYRHLIGADPEIHVLDSEIFFDLGPDDYTMDFDYPSDFEHYQARIEPALMEKVMA